MEAHPTAEGGVTALVALETSRDIYTLNVSFPESYPNAMPEVHVRRPALVSVAAQVLERQNLLPASPHVEPWPARPHVCDSASGQVVGEVRGIPPDAQVARGWDCPLGTMFIEFKSLPMMALRSRPGEVLDEVSREGTSFLIERNGQQLACLVPISCFLPGHSAVPHDGRA